MNKIKNWFKYTLKYKLSLWSFLRVLNSSLKGLKTHWYFGKIQHGTPYFFPRRTVSSKTKSGYMEFVPVKYFGFDLIGLGWKTKWDDIRFEWSPQISLVIFGKQLCIWFEPIVNPYYAHSYWEAWLTYKHRTNRKLSKVERTKEMFEKYSCTWISYKDNVKTYEDHYNFILKEKYLKLYKEIPIKTNYNLEICEV